MVVRSSRSNIKSSINSKSNKMVKNFRPPLKNYSRKRAKLPQTAEERALPMQTVVGIGTLNQKQASRMANKDKRERLAELDKRIDTPFGKPAAECPTIGIPNDTRGLTNDQAQEQANIGIMMRRVSKEEENKYPSKGQVQPFVVVEPGRLRVVAQCKQHNEYAYESDYKNEVDDMTGAGEQLNLAHAPAVAENDIKAAFYHRRLSPEASSFYRFRIDGQLYEFAALPMGLAVSAEYMHIITNIAAGNPRYVELQFAAQCPVKVWIDNIGYHGTDAMVRRAAQKLAENCKLLGLTLKYETKVHTREEDPIFTFCGVTYNLSKKTAAVAEKTLNKMPKVCPASLTAIEFESFIGRVIFCAQVHQIPLIRYWWLLKWARRQYNGLNNGEMSPDQTINFPDKRQRELTELMQTFYGEHEVVAQKTRGTEATLFSDATLTGWGAVLVFSSGRILSVGGKFSESELEAHKSINGFEALALQKGMQAFTKALQEVKELKILVDNTSVEANTRRANARAADLVEPIRRIWDMLISSRMSVHVGYIATDANPADSISRGALVDANQALKQANGERNWRSGAGQRLVIKK